MTDRPRRPAPAGARDERLEQLLQLRRRDPDAFRRLIPPREQIALGLYENAARDREGGDAA